MSELLCTLCGGAFPRNRLRRYVPPEGLPEPYLGEHPRICIPCLKRLPPEDRARIQRYRYVRPMQATRPDHAHKHCYRCGTLHPTRRLWRFVVPIPGSRVKRAVYVCEPCIPGLPAADRARLRATHPVLPGDPVPAPPAPPASPFAAVRDSPERVLQAHREVLADDPDRLSTEFILALMARTR
jgi:hypothetical protein